MSNITRPQAAALWLVLDRDHSGQVEKEEFTAALSAMQLARAWLRYCPECIYDNLCSYCQECNTNCDFCTDHSFCAAHWADHPARFRQEAGTSGGAPKTHVNATEMLRETLVIKPLEWAYGSQLMAWLSVDQKAAIRRVLRHQQLANEEASMLEDAAARKAQAHRARS